MLRASEKMYFKALIWGTITSVVLVFLLFPSPKEVSAYRYPSLCQPKIPFYYKARGNDELTEACYLLKQVEDTAYHQLSAAKRISSATNPLDECNPIYNCHMACSLGFPKFEYSVDITCALFPPLCTEEVMKVINDIYKLYQMYKKYKAVLDAVMNLKDDVTDLVATTTAAWQDIQNLAEEIPKIDLHDADQFVKKLEAIANAQQKIEKKINEVEARLEEMKKQVEANLATQKLGLTEDITKDLFSNELRTNLEQLTKTIGVEVIMGEDATTGEPIYGTEMANEFYYKFTEINEAVYKIDNYVSQPENGLSKEEASTTLAKMKEIEKANDKMLVSAADSVSIPEEILTEDILSYLAELKPHILELQTNLQDFENKFSSFSIPSTMLDPWSASSTEAITLINQKISENKPIIATILDGIRDIEDTTGMSMEELAGSLSSSVEEIKLTIQKQIMGERDESGITSQPIEFYLKEIYGPADTEAPGADFLAKFDQFDKIASSTQELIRNMNSLSGSQKNDLIAKLDEIREIASTTKTLVPPCHSPYIIPCTGLIGAIKQIEDIKEPTTGKMLRYLSGIKPYIVPLFQKLQTLQEKIDEFKEAVEYTPEIKEVLTGISWPPCDAGQTDCWSSSRDKVKCCTPENLIFTQCRWSNSPSGCGPNEVMTGIKWPPCDAGQTDCWSSSRDGVRCCKPAELIDCYWTGSTSCGANEVMTKIKWPNCDAGQTDCWHPEDGDSIQCCKIKDVDLTNCYSTASTYCGSYYLTDEDASKIFAKVDEMQSKFDEINTPVKEIHNRIQTIEMVSGMELPKVAYLFETSEKVDELIKMLHDVKEKAADITIGLDTTNAEIEEKCQEIRNDLTKIQLLLGPYFCATQPDNAYAGGCHYCKDKKCVKYYWDCNKNQRLGTFRDSSSV